MNILSSNEYKIINEHVAALLAQLDELLIHKDYDNVSYLLTSERFLFLSSFNSTLYMLRLIINIYLEESTQQIPNHIFLNRNLQDVQDLYTQLTFLLRRLEFNFPLDLQKEIVPFILNKNLSMVCVLGVIQQAPYSFNNELTLNSFRNLLNNM